MKTLNRQTTAAFFQSADGYKELTDRWSAIVRDPALRSQLTCAHYLVYAMLRGKNWHKVITRITNRKKLDNGAAEGWIGRKALNSIVNAAGPRPLMSPFEGVVCDTALASIQALLPEYRWSSDILAMEPYRDTE